MTAAVVHRIYRPARRRRSRPRALFLACALIGTVLGLGITTTAPAQAAPPVTIVQGC